MVGEEASRGSEDDPSEKSHRQPRRPRLHITWRENIATLSRFGTMFIIL